MYLIYKSIYYIYTHVHTHVQIFFFFEARLGHLRVGFCIVAVV